jgi:hypothetical protein
MVLALMQALVLDLALVQLLVLLPSPLTVPT